MLIGCGDCNPSATCDIKLMVAVVTPYGYDWPRRIREELMKL